jgi:hypothetical protein
MPDLPALCCRCTRVFDIVAQGKVVVPDLEIIARTPCRQMHYAYNSTFTVLVRRNLYCCFFTFCPRCFGGRLA